MNSKRLYLILAGAVGLLMIGLVVGAYLITAQLQKQADALAGAKQRGQVLQGEQVALTRAKSDIVKYRNLAIISKNIVPQDKDQAEAVRQIVKIAGDNQVQLGGISFPASGLGGTSGTSSSTSTAKLSQLAPVKGIAGVYGLQIVVQSDPDHPPQYSSFSNFLRGLENNRRTALVTAVNISPDVKDPNKVDFTLTLTEYIKP